MESDFTKQRLADLDELVAMGLEMARRLEKVTLEKAAADGKTEPDIDAVEAFITISRAVRQTIALQTEIAAGRPLRRSRAPTTEAPRAKARPEPVAAPAPTNPDQKSIVQRVVEQAIAAEASGSKAESLLIDMDELMESYDLRSNHGRLPIGAVALDLCEVLGLLPDWTRWAGEPWAMDEMRSKPAGSPYASRRALSVKADRTAKAEHRVVAAKVRRPN